MRDEYTEKIIMHLKNIISMHNNVYLKLFGSLRPKHHILEHYPMIIKESF